LKNLHDFDLGSRFRRVRHSRMLLAGIQVNPDWTPIITLGGDALGYNNKLKIVLSELQLANSRRGWAPTIQNPKSKSIWARAFIHAEYTEWLAWRCLSDNPKSKTCAERSRSI